MATANTSLRVADLDFFSIRENLKNYLKSQSEFVDYDFEGSGMSVLLDVLSYNTYYNGFYLNMAANEAFLDTAQVRQNILSQAKLINYVPQSAQGSLSKINVVVYPTAGSENTDLTYLVLDKYTRLLGADVDGENYNFVTVNANTAYKVGNSFSFSNVYIKQGEVVTLQYEMTANNLMRMFEIPSQNVDTTTISVYVQESSSNNMTYEYKMAKDITEVTANSFVYFLQENENLNYSIQFGDDYIGYKPKNGNIIVVTYLDTVGSKANNISKFSFVEKVGGYYRDNVRVTTVSSSYGGSDKETNEQIKFRAPQYYTAQNRCVTIKDYEALITKDYPNIDAVSVWGGEENDPIVYGKVFMSLKTKGYYSLSNLEKEQIKEGLIRNRNVLTVIPEIVDPDYVYIQVRGKVNFNPNLTSKSATEILESVRQAIIDYNTKELNRFSSTFRKSKLQYYIENCDPAITGSDITIYLQRQMILSLGISKKYTIQYNAPIKKGTFEDKLYSFPTTNVRDSSGALRSVFFEEVPASYTGVDSIDIINSGINYSSPVVTITGDGTDATASAVVINGKITEIKIINKGVNYTRATVTITDTGTGSQAVAVAKLESKFGDIRTFYYKPNGEKVIINENSGTINYDTGVVELLSLNPVSVTPNDFYDTDVLTINAVPQEEIISPLRNRILVIDSNVAQSIQLEMIAES